MTQAFWASKQSTGRGICPVNSIRFWEYDWTGGVFLTLIRTASMSDLSDIGCVLRDVGGVADK
jgi:hypothetical protein